MFRARRVRARIPELRRKRLLCPGRRRPDLCAVTTVGIDVGGTKVLGATVHFPSGRVLQSGGFETRPTRGGRAVLAQTVTLAEQLVGGREDVAIGVGLCELVGRDGQIGSAATIDWQDSDVVGAFSHLGPVCLESDVRAAALAEARIGAGREYNTFIYLSVGTGISYSLVIDGAPYVGENGWAIIVGAPCVELVASGRALERASGLTRAKDVVQSDAYACLTQAATDALGAALAALVNALDPAAVVIGGGLGLNAHYRAAATAAARKRIEHPNRATLPIVPAVCGPNAGVIGAAMVANERYPPAAVGALSAKR